MDDTFQRPSQPWERADGAFRLIGEMGIYAPQKVTDKLLEKMVSAASITHYPHHCYLLETGKFTCNELSYHLSGCLFIVPLQLATQ